MSAAEMAAVTMQTQAATATAVASEEPPPAPTGDPGVILGAVLAALEQEGHNSPVRELEKGSAIIQGSELIVTLGLKQVSIDGLFLADAMRVANSAASAAAGRPM